MCLFEVVNLIYEISRVKFLPAEGSSFEVDRPDVILGFSSCITSVHEEERFVVDHDMSVPSSGSISENTDLLVYYLRLF